MSSRELTGWLEYQKLFGPIGPEREDILHAKFCAEIVNTLVAIHTKKKDRGRPLTIKDFLPQWEVEEEPDPEELAEQQLSKWQAIRSRLPLPPLKRNQP